MAPVMKSSEVTVNREFTAQDETSPVAIPESLSIWDYNKAGRRGSHRLRSVASSKNPVQTANFTPIFPVASGASRG